MPYYSSKPPFRPRKPVRSFRDLEVYQRALEMAVVVAKEIYPHLATAGTGRAAKSGVGTGAYPFLSEMLTTSLDIPRLIAEAHSVRFESQLQGIALLEKAMGACNKMVVYIEQVRDIYPEQVKSPLCEDLIKKYVVNRTRIFHLQKTWQRWAADAAIRKIMPSPPSPPR